MKTNSFGQAVTTENEISALQSEVKHKVQEIHSLLAQLDALTAERDKLKRLIEESFTEWQWCPKTEQLFRKVDGHVYHAKVGMHKRWSCFHNGQGGAHFKTIAAFDKYIAERRSPATTEGRDNG